MMLFWLAVAALSVGAAALIVGSAARSQRVTAEADPALNLYRRQMSELDELVERGVLDPNERRTAEAEAGRRLLAAAERDKAASSPVAQTSRRPVAILAVLAPLAAIGVYLMIGAPGLKDQPMAERILGWRQTNPAALQPAQMAAVLEGLVKERPGDAEALRFLAQAQLASEQPFEAEANLRKAITLAPQRADLWNLLGQAILAQGDGSLVGADAAEAFAEALERDPSSQSSRYFVGRALIESGQPAEGVAHWKTLLANLPPGAPGREGLAADIAAVERTGKLPPPAPATAEAPEMEGAIQGMVDGLAARLADNPDDPEGWVRLVRAYTVLGDTAKRDAALATARARYKDQPAILDALKQAIEAPR